MWTSLAILLAAQAAALPAPGRVTSQYTKLAHPSFSGTWGVASERALPQAFQLGAGKLDVFDGENCGAVAGTSAPDVWSDGISFDTDRFGSRDTGAITATLP